MIIKEISGMQGLFASREYKINEVICEIKGEILNKPTRTSIQVENDKHINVKAPLAFINHSCFPNINIDSFKVKVVKPIKMGDQICFDYNFSEFDLANKFKCVDCGQWIKGKKFKVNFPCLKVNRPNDEIIIDKLNSEFK